MEVGTEERIISLYRRVEEPRPGRSQKTHVLSWGFKRRRPSGQKGIEVKEEDKAYTKA